MIEETELMAAAIIDRCQYELSGYVLTHLSRNAKVIVYAGATRWFPDPADFARAMEWIDPMGPSTPEDGFDLDRSPAVLAATTASARSVLTVPRSTRLLETTKAALGALARELGCVWNDDIPHNPGWFVPGKPKAFASAFDAIQGLVTSLKAGGTVYERRITSTNDRALRVTGEAKTHATRMQKRAPMAEQLSLAV